MAFERKQSLKDCGSFQGLIDSGTMPLVTVILRKFLFLIQCVVAGISRAFSLGRKKANIGELPFTVPKSDRAEYQPGHSSMPPQTQSWDDGWQNSGASFEEQAVSSKIEEYRRRKAEELQMREEPQASTEPDFFGDMQPTIKADKTVLFKNNPATAASSSKQPRNLFAFNEDSVRLPQRMCLNESLKFGAQASKHRSGINLEAARQHCITGAIS
ncbi:hypothetical protein L596_014422 [Steinernema carpocapsae]|uniref:Uncharacterized protein n=1 Tax=Steinernema carpocapsae TaxID=34508 RepID=A0A4U5NBY6_STECR|nr:hypothetical protein L596_014422 [Steinernema carpocapsae]